MSDPITPEIFDHLVGLAALELSPDEAEYLRRQLNQQLKSIAELTSIPLEASIPPAAHGVPYPPEISPAPRPDEWQPSTLAAGILGQVPRLEEDYIAVPDIPHTELK